MKSYECPVCFYDGLSSPPDDHNICPCCRTQFGYDDSVSDGQKLKERHLALRAKWVLAGANFWYENLKPSGWSSRAQISRGLRDEPIGAPFDQSGHDKGQVTYEARPTSLVFAGA